MKKKFSIINFAWYIILGMVIIGGMDYFIKNKMSLIWAIVGLSLTFSLERVKKSKHDE
jgi:hypothetical protein